MKILGIDPGYDRLGLAIVEKLPRQKETLLYSVCLTTDKKEEFHQRLTSLGLEVEQILTKWTIDKVAIENLFIATNQKTAMRVAEVRGMLLYLAGRKNIPILELTPLQIKKNITGYGSAPKDQVMTMAKLLIDIPPRVKLDDEFDAIVIALSGLVLK